MQLKNLLKRHRSELALLIGNGINRYQSQANNNSWDALLRTLARQHLPDFGGQVPSGISLTEFYDVLELGLRGQSTDGHQRQTDLLSLQQQSVV